MNIYDVIKFKFQSRESCTKNSFAKIVIKYRFIHALALLKRKVIKMRMIEKRLNHKNYSEKNRF